MTSRGYFIHRDPGCLFVEAWSAWHLPFMNLTSAQSQYRDELRTEIKNLRANGTLHATYTSPQDATRAPDLENVLFYNLGTSVFREVAKDVLRFVRKDAPAPDTQAALSFAPRHHVRYQVGNTETWRHNAGAVAASALVVCREMKELKDLAVLWKLFKAAVTSNAETILQNEDPFVLRMVISVPEGCHINLAEVMKPLTDAFISALHHYQGEQLDPVVSRLSGRLKCSPDLVQGLLLQEKAALLGPRAVPHLRGEGLQWSPADDLLVAGEFVRENSRSGLISVVGQVSCASRRLAP